MAFRLHPLTASLALSFTAAAAAQPSTLEPVTVEGKSAPVLEPSRAEVSGFGEVPILDLAQSVSVVSRDALAEADVRSLSQLTRLEASLSDAYNTLGYHQSLTVRGFVLDNVYNFRRDGLPVLNFGPAVLTNKSRVEVLKGTSGMLAGISAPGGLVNFVTERAGGAARGHLQLAGGERGTLGAAGYAQWTGAQVRVRADASSERLRPLVRNAEGERHVASVALDATLGAHTLSFDLEAQKYAQPSVPGWSPLDRDGDGVGDTLPEAQPRVNLNAQPWTQPFKTQSVLAAVKWTHALNETWRLRAAAQSQRVRTDDRVAFPDGCSTAETYVYPGFCGNGDYDLYDFRSDNERRTLHVLDAHAVGTYGATVLTFGAQRRTFKQRTQAQAYNYVGTGNVYAPITPVPAAPEATSPGTDLDDASTELYAHARSKLGANVNLFLGLRHARIDRASIRTDGTEAVSVSQTVTTPWLGASWNLTPRSALYASWGRGAESEFVPNRPLQYVNFGAALPVLKSEQRELGWKWQPSQRTLATVALFEIRKPFADDAYNDDGLAERIAGAKSARHRGVELSAVGKFTPWLAMQASAAYLDAVFTSALDTALVGKRVTNIPRLTTSLLLDVQVPQVKGLGISALFSSQSAKAVSADNTLQLPPQFQLDLGARYTLVSARQSVTWRLHVENVTNRGGWREAPTQSWGGVYLMPMPARSVRASVGLQW